ncbi:hypothetical protein PCANC_19827 [Puccinia coronata f. sp. avenae]|uniref:Uncharacterized protein n=1 Tax=Puccinia coronata f. sp. avenae TaxID=200324 RepID=A0A2N5UA18_9BASI|nr:hypothetical protein PCANC_19827 [Puccinia coronata f. sp. avenae]PLW41340.1 hypothetical protein PCASD_08907 [Puccinia coronata f. sp. avenae]
MLLRVGSQPPGADQLFSAEHGTDLDNASKGYSLAEMLEAWHQLEQEDPVLPSHHQSIPVSAAQENHLSANDEHLLGHPAAAGPPPIPHLPFHNNNAPKIHHHPHSHSQITVGPTINEWNLWLAQSTSDSSESVNGPFVAPLYHISPSSTTPAGALETTAGLHSVLIHPDSSHTTSVNPPPHNVNLAFPENPNPSPARMFMSSTRPEPTRLEESRRLHPIQKPSCKDQIPIRKRTRKNQSIAPGFSAGRSQANSIPLSSNTPLISPHLTNSLIGSLTGTDLHEDMMIFDATLFAPTNPFSVAENNEIKFFQDKIKKLTNELLIFPKESFLSDQKSFRYRNRKKMTAMETSTSHVEKAQGQQHFRKQNRPTSAKRPDLMEAEDRMADKLHEFAQETHINSWYQRWWLTTGANLRINPHESLYEHFRWKKHKNALLPFYLLYVEIICSIVREKWTTSKHIAHELRSARDTFISLTEATADTAKIEEDDLPLKWMAERLQRQVTSTNGFTKNTYPILWTYLHHWMLTRSPKVFDCFPYKFNSASVKEFFNNVFIYTYSSLYQKYAVKYSSGINHL